jgi:hypothetical protein
VQRTPGFPCALSFEGDNSEQTSGTCREIADLCLTVIASAAKQSIKQQESKKEWIASLRSQ